MNQKSDRKSEKKNIISPIAIDLGAQNTGVFTTHYEAGSKLEDIKNKEGKVYTLDKDNYTYLMVNRTANRHQKRGYDRRQMAKRLFKLIWCEHFKFEWNGDIQQTLSFLLNRRGFTFLDGDYNKEILSEFPKEAFNRLPEKIQEKLREYKNKNDDTYDMDRAVDLANKGTKQEEELNLDEVKKQLDEVIGKVKNNLFLYQTQKKLYEYCSKRKNNEKIPIENTKKQHLSQLSKWILEKWIKQGIQGLPAVPSENTVNMVDYLNQKKPEISEKILKSLNQKKLGIKELETEEKELKKSVWNWNPEKFNLEKANFDPPEQDNEKLNNKYIKTHLHHLAFAIDKIYNELNSGARHRRKYFNEIKDVLEEPNHTHGYLKRFCKKLKSGNFKNLTAKNLCNLIGHISNLELKPLRKYFNDKKHKEKDYWDEQRLAYLFGRWIISEWRVGEKDKEKIDDNYDFNYKNLKQKWKSYKKDNKNVIDFFLETDPQFTIPPYQDSNNRKPPKCQSLILNVNYLNKKYSNWKDWLNQLQEIESVNKYLQDDEQKLNYKQKLKNLKSSKGKPYFSEEEALSKDSGKRSMQELDARILQFIFDRVKAKDSLNLNTIYSYAKKIRQDKHNDSIKVESADQTSKSPEELLKDAIKKSQLPEELKNDPDDNTDDLFKEGTFLHLVCKYYKFRTRAKEGRIYIHPKYHYVKGRGYENTGQFDDKNHLLTYCNHKPRQKRYQMLEDLSSVLQVSPDHLKKYIEKEILLNNSSDNLNEKQKLEKQIDQYLSNIKGLKTKCKKAAQEQKNRRGSLKSDINKVFYLIDYRKENKNPSKIQIQKILKKSNINDAHKLYNFCEKAKTLIKDLYKDLYDDSQKNELEKDLNRNPATAVYLLAQINNIVFKERNGNAKTCVVCNQDNAYRMQMVLDKKAKGITAKAQRLPAISTRIIDGAVMRIARIKGKAIVKEKWSKVKEELEKGYKVHIPIIMESNQFEFEPSRETLVTKQRASRHRKSKALTFDKAREKESKIFESTIDRIKEASKGICPYTGKAISDESGEGEIDHIIPRTSEYGTLNDEANLIWASKLGNQHKTNQPLCLSNLSKKYKTRLFPNQNDDQIKDWILDTIWDKEKEDFKFGKYLSFINLNPDEQKAFRHALFLKECRKAVIDAINNRNRAFVNGTQRYFAQVLANQFYKKLLDLNNKRKNEKPIDKNSLSFDYFEIPAFDVKGDRENLENKKDKCKNPIYPELQEHKKLHHKTNKNEQKEDKNAKPQTPYSHIIDAQLAFAIAVSKHKNNGSLKLVCDNISLSNENKTSDENKTSEIEDIFNEIKIPKTQDQEQKLVRQLPFEHKKWTHRPLFNENAVAMHFLKLIQISCGNDTLYLKGFLDLNELKTCLENNDWKTSFKDKKYPYATILKEELSETPQANQKSKKNQKKKKGKTNENDSVIKMYKETFVYNNQKSSTNDNLIKTYKINNKVFKIYLYKLDKTKVIEFLFEHYNIFNSNHNLNESQINTLKQLKKLWYFTQKKNVIDKDKLYSPSDEKFKCNQIINPHLRNEWKKIKEFKKEQLEKYFLYKKTGKKHKHPHQRKRKIFSLPITIKTGILIKKKNWKREDVFYFRLQKQISKTIFHKDKSNRLSNVYRRNNMIILHTFNKLSFNDFQKLLQPIDKNNAIDPNEWHEISVPEEFKDYIEKIKIRRTEETKTLFKFSFKDKKMSVKLLWEFCKKYPLRGIALRGIDSLDDFEKYLKDSKKAKEIYEKVTQEPYLEHSVIKPFKDWIILKKLMNNKLVKNNEKNNIKIYIEN